MIVIEKEGDRFILRPAVIGFIKNNAVRRLLMVLFAPFVLVLTLAFNLALANARCLFLFIRDIINIRTGLMKLWHHPRKAK